MSVGTGTPPAQTATCCICAQTTDRGTRDKTGRFVCADCLERARQAIMDRRARAAREKVEAKLAEEVARVESDNSAVLQWQSALDPAFALLCPNCGRILHLDVGACHACGYGVDNQATGKRFSLFGRRRSRKPVAPHLLALDASWLNAIDPRIEQFLPLALALILWTTTVIGFFRVAARISASILVTAALVGLAGWFLLTLSTRSPKTAAWSALPPIASLVLLFVDPAPAHPNLRWVGLGILVLATSFLALLRVRGSFTGLWLVTLIPALALIVGHAAQ